MGEEAAEEAAEEVAEEEEVKKNWGYGKYILTPSCVCVVRIVVVGGYRIAI